jgi:uncharacterized surface protein with fasciclin (FAS1) repeats
MFRRILLVPALMVALTLVACVDDSQSPLAPDAVLLDAAERRGPPANANAAPAPGTATIVDLVMEAAAAEEDAEFTLLLAAVLYIAETNPESPLVAGLFDRDQYTVFAPTDAAFVGLVTALGVAGAENPFAAIDDLLFAGAVEAVVSYHVVEGRRAANSVVPRVGTRTVQTLLDGATFQVRPDLSIQAIGNEANIVTANISASNGIVHVIDAVILPLP